MINCRQATALMSQEMDRPLTRLERLALRFHTLLCVGCRRYRRQMTVLRDACRRLSDNNRLSPPTAHHD
ncbi:MAG: zf-HC2 domain-containing protein [Candidatus Accumulibacter sp.]|nr:zf-HC2 domain-containing protein [Accumulibacter sp.]